MLDQTESDAGSTDPSQRACPSKSSPKTAQVCVDRAAESGLIAQLFVFIVS